MGSLCIAAEAENEIGPSGLGLNHYREVLQEELRGLESLIPLMIESAEESARAYVEDDFELTVMGDSAGYTEAVGRAGGLMNLRGPGDLRRFVEKPMIVLFYLRDDHFAEPLHRHLRVAIDQSRAGHWKVIGIGRAALLALAREQGLEMLGELPVSARPQEGLWSRGEWGVVPVSPVLKNVVLWMWTGEFIAAASRRGVMPPVYLAFAMPGGQERANGLKGLRFHEESPEPVPAGRLAGRYLETVTAAVEDALLLEESSLVEVAERLLKGRENGARLWGFYHSHALIRDQVGYPGDPGFFSVAHSGWHRLQMNPVELNGDDWMLCMGFNEIFSRGPWNGLDETLRERGVNLIWSFAVHREEDRQTVKTAGEMLIEQHWPPGDAVLELEGYDIPILPVSGAISHALLWGLQAEMVWRTDPNYLPTANAY